MTEEPQTAGDPSPIPTPATSSVEAPARAPIAALRRERERRKAEQARAEGLERELQTHTLRLSRRHAVRAHGEDAVAALEAWAADRRARDPAFNQVLKSSDDPYDDAFRAHGEEAIAFDSAPEGPVAIRTRRDPPAAAPQPAPAPPVPRSLANAAGNGAAAPRAPIGPGQAFAAAILR